MPPAPLPPKESERLAALRRYKILDTMCEDSFDDLTCLAAKLTNCPTALVSLIDKERQWFKSRYGLDAAQTHRDAAFCAHAILTPHVPTVVPDATQDQRFIDNPLVTGEFGLRFYAGVPLVDPDGHALGTLCVLDYQTRQLSKDAVYALGVLAKSVCTTLELRYTMLQLREMSLSDSLTTLSNRTAFMFVVQQAIARQRRDGNVFTIIYLDLDGFKEINDRFGHAIGDCVLEETAEILRTSIRTEDTAARIGGDEFAMVLVGGDGSEAYLVTERIRASLQAAMTERGWPVTASIGAVTFIEPPPDETIAIALADENMYLAKNKGKNRAICSDYHPAPGSKSAIPQAHAKL